MKSLRCLTSIISAGFVFLFSVLAASSELTAETLETGTLETGPLRSTGPSAVMTAPTESSVDSATLPKVRIDAGGLTAEAFVGKLLAEMTFAEKLGQMQQIYPDGNTLAADAAQQIRAGQAGSIFFVGHPQQVREAQRVAVEQSRLGIPLLVARDVIHGLRTVFPIPIGQASSWNPALVKRAAAIAASESRHVGIHWTFAPMVDVTRDPRWGRIAESCGEDPVLASALGVAMVEGFQSRAADGTLAGIAACPKHFAAYGLAEGGRDYNRAMVSRSELRNVFLSPFKACIDAGAVSLMSAFNSVNGIPATGHRRLLRNVLKDEWRFPGFVVSDWGSVPEMMTHGYTADKRQSAQRALAAGVDMEMVTTCYAENLESLVAANVDSMALIDDAVRRILLAKVRLNLFAQPYAEIRQPELACAQHLQVARELAQQSVVLLKNTGVLPLQKSELNKIAVVGPFADAPQDQLGAWAMDGKSADSITPLVALQEQLGDGVELSYVPCTPSKYGECPEQIAEAVAVAASADVTLLFVGEEATLSGEAHSRVRLSLPGSQSDLVAALAAGDTPLVMIVMAGRPLTLGAETAAADALLYAWHPGTMAGPALADLLLGVVSPSGKLPVTFPRSVGQIPLYYNHPSTGRPASADYRAPPLPQVVEMTTSQRYGSHYIDADPFPLFPFGFGLTYTKFQYNNLNVQPPSLQAQTGLVVSVRVANVGDVAATEIVQLYTRDRVASAVRPVQELKDFRRVTIQPGTTTTVRFKVPQQSLGFFDADEQYVVEAGEFEVSVGGSSDTSFSTEPLAAESMSAKFSIEIE